MATPRHPRFPLASGRRREGGSLLAQAQTILLSQQGARVASQRDMAVVGTPRRKVLNTTGLGKCDLDMTTADFRTWCQSLEDWVELNNVGDGDAARYIRMLCAPALQKTLNARFLKAEWDALSVVEVLENLKNINSLRAYCVVFKAAERDAHRFPPNRHPEAAASDVTHEAVSDDVIAVASPRKACHRPCGYCGDRHQPGKTSCPAANATCLACVGSWVTSRKCAEEERRSVSVPEGSTQHSTTAIADTGGQHLWPLHPAGCVFCEVSAASLPVSRRLQGPGPGTGRLPAPATPGCGERGRAAARSSSPGLPPRPVTMPLPPLEKNIPRLQEWLLGHFSVSTFDTDRYPLPVMAGPPHHIHLMVVVAKKSGKPRHMVVFQKLNACCKQETHHSPTPYPIAKCTPDEIDVDQDVDIAAAISLATVAALDLSGCATIEDEMVLQVALEDPTYQSLVLRVSSGD
ncbi:hypothetical protein E2C01_034001 [Portunus trituberculatus]|uniref:Uncharacterized protein n=1 Tax=Portunus trituberculatus TaxID=210409 RepID=A0A5B7F7B6_PORTR|nr:hypothetical protein [Portunus trituberculatus]